MNLGARALSLIFEGAIHTAIIALDHQGRVLAWSGGATRILGWTPEQMLGQTLERIFEPDDLPAQRLADEMADALRLGRGGHEGWRVCADGRRIWASGEMTPVHDDSGSGVAFVKVLRDQTSWKVADDALREETRILEALNRAGAMLVGDNDLERLLQGVTDAGRDVTGAEFGAFFHQVTEAGAPAMRLYTLSGAPVKAFSSFPMPRSTPLFDPTFNNQGIVRCDDVRLDPRFGRNSPFRGMPPGHLTVASYLAVPVVARSGGAIGSLLFGHSKPGVFTEQCERALVLLASEAAIAIDNARLMAQAQQELAERRRAEAALQELNATLESQVAQRTEELQQKEAALRQAQKMEAVGQLTGGLAHDFNNLLMGIMGSLELLQRRIAQGDMRDLARYAASAHGAARRAAALTHRLLAFSRRQTLDPQPTDVNRLVLDMQELVARTVGPAIDVEVVTGPDVWTTLVDANQLENALLNLCINARDAMPNGGRLTIETAKGQIDQRAGELHEMEPGAYVVLSVTDSGTGMPPDVIQRAFDPFFTTKPIGVGTGLGLSMVYGFTRQSGGQVRIHSEVGRGTTVRLYLPRLANAAAAESEAPPVSPALDSVAMVEGGARVLVVDDEQSVRMIVADVLREMGCQVFDVEDGEGAIAMLRGDVTALDLLITDIGLAGGMSGRQVAEAARTLQPRLKVLFITGYADVAAVSHGHVEAGTAMLPKPFTVDELARRVRLLLAGSRAAT